MSRNTQADALPQWAYILVVTLLIPFAIILTLALTGMNVSDTWIMVASTCILVAITFISHLRQKQKGVSPRTDIHWVCPAVPPNWNRDGCHSGNDAPGHEYS